MSVTTRLGRLERQPKRYRHRQEQAQPVVEYTDEEVAEILQTLYEALGADGFRAFLSERISAAEVEAIMAEIDNPD